MERVSAPHKKDDAHREDEEAVLEREVDDALNHVAVCSFMFSTARENCSALAATSSPTFAPLRICWKPSAVAGSACTSVRRNCFASSLTNTQSRSCNRKIALTGTDRRLVLLCDTNCTVPDMLGFIKRTALGRSNLPFTLPVVR